MLAEVFLNAGWPETSSTFWPGSLPVRPPEEI